MIENSINDIDDEDDGSNSSGGGNIIPNHSDRAGLGGQQYLGDSQLLISSVDGLTIRDSKVGSGKDVHEEHPERKFYRAPLPAFLNGNDDLMRNITLGLGVLTMLISGTLYGFAVISVDVKKILDFDQTEISNAISIGDVGIYFGLTVGYLYDLYGPFYTSLISTAFYLLGYLGFYSMIKGDLPANAYLLSFFLFLVGQASHASFTASIISNIHNFSLKHRGKVSGALVGLFATSSGVFGIIYRHTFSKTHDVEGYLLFLTILCSSIAFLGAFFIRYIGPKRIEDTMAVDNSSLGELEEVSGTIKEDKEKKYNLLAKDSLAEEDTNQYMNEVVGSNPNYLDGKRDITGIQLLKTEEFWLLFIVYFFVAGTCLMFLNNIGSVGKSNGKSADLRTDLVIVFAACNLTGRSSFGFLSDMFAKRISRFWFLAISASIISITHLLYAFFTSEFYIFATIFTGIGYGGLVSTMVLLTSVRFGVRRFGLNFGMLAIASAAGSLTFGFISGKLYDEQAEESEGDDDECYGEKCFRTSFVLSFVFNALCIGVILFLIHRSKRHTY